METYAVAIPAIDVYIAVMYIHVCRCSSCPVVQTVELKTTPIPFCLQSAYSFDIRGVCQSRKQSLLNAKGDNNCARTIPHSEKEKLPLRA